MSTIPVLDRRVSPSERQRGPAPGHLILGALLVLFGLAWLLGTTGAADVPWDTVLVVALIGVGLAIAAEARRGTSGWLVTLGLVLTAILTLTSLVDVELRGGVGERVYEPRTAAELRTDYRLAAGQLTLDLGSLAVANGTTALASSVGLGEIVVTVPPDAAVRIEARAGLGGIVIFGTESDDDVDVTEQYSSPGYDTAARRVSLDLSVGIGKIEVRR